MAHAMTFGADAPSADQPGLFARIRETIVNYTEFARIRDELNAFSDRDLADIGVSRHNIPDVARAAVYGN